MPGVYIVLLTRPDQPEFTWGHRRSWKLPFPRIGQVVAEEVVREPNGIAGQIVKLDPVAKISILVRDGLPIVGHEFIDDQLAKGDDLMHFGLAGPTPLVLRCIRGHDLVLNGGGNRKIDQQRSIHSVACDTVVVHAVVAQCLCLQACSCVEFDLHIGCSLVFHSNGDFQLIRCARPAYLDILKDRGGIEAAQLTQGIRMPGGQVVGNGVGHMAHGLRSIETVEEVGLIETVVERAKTVAGCIGVDAVSDGVKLKLGLCLGEDSRPFSQIKSIDLLDLRQLEQPLDQGKIHPAVDPVQYIALRPVLIHPIDAQGVVHVVGNEVEFARGGIVVEIIIVLVVGIVVPVAGDHFIGEDLQKSLEVEEFIQSTLELVEGCLIDHGDELCQVAVVVLLHIGLQLVGPPAVGAGELVVVRVARDECEVCWPDAFVQIAVVIPEARAQPIVIDVLDVGIKPVVASIDVQLGVPGAGDRQFKDPSPFPAEKGPAHRRVIVLPVQIDLLDAFEPSSVLEGIHRDLE